MPNGRKNLPHVDNIFGDGEFFLKYENNNNNATVQVEFRKIGSKVHRARLREAQFYRKQSKAIMNYVLRVKLKIDSERCGRGRGSGTDGQVMKSLYVVCAA